MILLALLHFFKILSILGLRSYSSGSSSTSVIVSSQALLQAPLLALSLNTGAVSTRLMTGGGTEDTTY